MKRYFCTLFDTGYLIKGLVTLQSLKANCGDVQIFVLCMDDGTYDYLTTSGLDYVTCIRLSELEDEELLEVKKKRGVAEYCWTLSPCLPWYVFQNFPHVDQITYIDADLLFFSSVEPIFEEMGEKSIAIIEHRFPERLKDREVNGRFCVEWVSFKRNEEGLACLSRWRDQCIEWCYYRLEEGRMGDQKYLDEWPERYPGCHIIQHLGAGVAPWNYERYTFGKDAKGTLQVDGQILIFYHFHQFQLLPNNKFDRLSSFYTNECKEPEAIYSAYEAQLTSALRTVRNRLPDFSAGIKKPTAVYARRWVQRFVPFVFKRMLQKMLRY